MSRRFGFELEFSSERIQQDSLRNYFNQSLLQNDPNQKLLRHENGRTWTIKNDGSCGTEITSPILFANMTTFNVLKDIIRQVRSGLAGQRVIQRSCGFHVHIDIQDLNKTQIQNMMKIFQAFEPCLLSLQPRSRSNNNYCVPLGTSFNFNNFDPDDDMDGDYSDHTFDRLLDHTSAINFQNFMYRGTIEIRYGAGTIHPLKIVNWIQILMVLIEIAKHINEPITLSRTECLDDMIDFMQSKPVKIPWLERRKSTLSQWMLQRHADLRQVV